MDQKIMEELGECDRSKLSFAFTIFLATVSTAFIAETNDPSDITVSSSLTVVVIKIAVVFLVVRVKRAVKN